MTVADLPPASGAIGWPAALPYDEWHATCDTLHAYTQLLGKLAVALAPPEPQLEHAALRCTARGWETALLPSPDGSGGLVAVLDLHGHRLGIEHTDGRGRWVGLTPNRPVGAVTREVLAALRELAGAVEVRTNPQEVPWTVRLDEDEEHATYDLAHVARYRAVAARAALVLAALRAPFRGRVSPVDAWWGSFDLAVTFHNGRPCEPPSSDFISRNTFNTEHISLGWWPGDARHPSAAFYAYASPAPETFAAGRLTPPAAHFDQGLGEFLLDWDDLAADPHPFTAAIAFGRSALALACATCGWDSALSDSSQGIPPPME